MSLTEIIKGVKEKAKKTAFALGLGALAFLPIQKADAGFMQIKTYPVQSTWIADGITEYEVQVRVDSTDVSNKKIKSTEWDLTIPFGLESYLNFTRATLPDGTNYTAGPSTNPNDFFHNILMNSGSNFVDTSISNGELDNNGRLRKNASEGAQNRDFEHGILGNYYFTVNLNTLAGNYEFGLNSIYIRNTDTSDNLYYWLADDDNLNCQVTNQQFTIKKYYKADLNRDGDVTGEIDPTTPKSDAELFIDYYLSKDLRADFRGVGFGIIKYLPDGTTTYYNDPDGEITQRDIDGFASEYQEARQEIGYSKASSMLELTSLPDPSTFALLGLGAGIAGLSRRLRRKS